jgi:transposase
LAIAAVLDGASREEAATLGGMERQTLRDWVIRFNDEGPEGVSNKPSPGAPCKLHAEHKEFSLVSSTRSRSRRFMAWCAGEPAIWLSNCTLSSVCRYRMPRFTGR